jgi:universal stress protein A
MKPIRNILVGTDFSIASRAAFRHAVELAAANGAALWIAHVAVPPVPLSPDGYVLPSFYDDMAAAMRADAQRHLGPMLTRAKKAGVRAEALTLVGAPHDALNRAARRHRADLIVVGTHGRTGLARFFVGSVASRVVATAPCPVMTIRGRLPNAAEIKEVRR